MRRGEAELAGDRVAHQLDVGAAVVGVCIVFYIHGNE